MIYFIVLLGYLASAYMGYLYWKNHKWWKNISFD